MATVPDLPNISTPSTFATRAAAREAAGRPADRSRRPRDVEVLGDELVLTAREPASAPLVGGADLEVA